MIVLGVDPGTALLGYGVVDDGDGDRGPSVQTYGVFSTAAGSPMTDRLLVLFDRMSALIETHRPGVLAIEQLFFARNVTTALAVGQARGVVLLAAARAGMQVVEYTPSQVKQAVVGYGKADKVQMQEMVRLILGLPETPHPDDAADALAIALCHIQTAPFLQRTQAPTT